ncbi:hypothetical protein GGR56DRAFT_515183 [Xylariaceae sp. FL0804]|nr:hypothetical protein GGR56DRAFT_515183 [Xylariaceae sp. FL0804]
MFLLCCHKQLNFRYLTTSYFALFVPSIVAAASTFRPVPRVLQAPRLPTYGVAISCCVLCALPWAPGRRGIQQRRILALLTVPKVHPVPAKDDRPGPEGHTRHSPALRAEKWPRVVVSVFRAGI